MGQEIEAKHEPGPAMLALSDQQQLFVVRFLEVGGLVENAADAAARAGYSTHHPKAAAVAASRLLRQPKVITAIREEADMRLRAGAILGASVLIQTASDPTNKNQFRAAVELLNRSDLIVASRQEIIVDDRRDSRTSLVDRVRTLGGLLGVDVEQLLKPFLAEPVDAEFTEIVQEEEW